MSHLHRVNNKTIALGMETVALLTTYQAITMRRKESYINLLQDDVLQYGGYSRTACFLSLNGGVEFYIRMTD